MSLITVGKELFRLQDLQGAKLGFCEPKGEPSERFHQDFLMCSAAWGLELARREEEKSEFKARKNQPSIYTAARVKYSNSQIKKLLFRKEKMHYSSFLWVVPVVNHTYC